MHSVLGSSDAVGWLLSALIGWMPRGILRSKGLLREGVQTFIPYGQRRAGSSNDLFQLARLPQYPLSEIRKPTLVIHGTADRVACLSNAEFAADAIPQAQLIRIAGAGHGVFFEQHHWLAPKILEFLKAHAPTGLAAAGTT
jgi:pimeloyl-ACP methyl ester carboxylesterase